MKRYRSIVATAFVYWMQDVKSEIIPIANKGGITESYSSVMKHREEQVRVFVNPCTGSISTEEKTPDQLPCLNASNMPSASKQPSLAPSSAPSSAPSAVPTTRPSSKPAPENVAIIPITPTKPRKKCIKCRDSESTVKVEFDYIVETTSSVTDVTTVLPALEETLLKKLADKLLQHCLNNDISVNVVPTPPSPTPPSNGSGAGNGQRSRYQRRNLNLKRKLSATTVGICSAPKDNPHPTKTCDPELDVENNCFVIEGGVTVSVEDLETEEKIIEIITETTKETMDKDELLTDDNPEVEDVRFLEEEDDDGITPIPPLVSGPIENGDTELPLILGATFGILALLLAGGLLRSKKYAAAGIAAGKADGTFAAPVGCDVHASTMDVHACTSAACPRCYEQNQGIKFVNAPEVAPPPRAVVEDGIPSGWMANSSIESSSFESSSTTEFYS